MTAELPPQTRLGHAEDCGACLYESLSDEDKAGFDPATVRTHTRRPPPTLPQLPNWPAVVVVVGFITCVVGFLNGPVFGLVGALIMFPGVIAWGYIAAEWRGVERRWRADYTAWKAEQTKVRLAARKRGELWYCPTCAELSCSNQHSDTEPPITGKSPWTRRARSRPAP
jgi:hypothetical protein